MAAENNLMYVRNHIHQQPLPTSWQSRECEVAMAKWQPALESLSINSVFDIPFYEGDFLRMLLSKVERMLDSGYGMTHQNMYVHQHRETAGAR